MRTIRILFAIFSFSIFSHDLQLRSSDLFRFSAADLGGLGVAVADGCNAPSVAVADGCNAPSVAAAATAAIALFKALCLLMFLLSSACAVLQSPRQVSQTNFRGVLDEQNVNSRLHKVNTYLKSSFRQPSSPIPPKY